MVFSPNPGPAANAVPERVLECASYMNFPRGSDC